MTYIYYSFQADKAICEDTIRQLLERCEQLDAQVEVSLGISFFDLYRVVGHVTHMCVYAYMYVHVCRYICVCTVIGCILGVQCTSLTFTYTGIQTSGRRCQNSRS